MHGDDIAFAYGFWSLVVVNVGIFVLLTVSYLAPLKRREWQSMFAPRFRIGHAAEPRWGNR